MIASAEIVFVPGEESGMWRRSGFFYDVLRLRTGGPNA